MHAHAHLDPFPAPFPNTCTRTHTYTHSYTRCLSLSLSITQAKSLGGVLVTMLRPPGAGPNYGPFLEWVRFQGRVLYPSSVSVYKNLLDPVSRRK